jgi:hypothetical protein
VSRDGPDGSVDPSSSAAAAASMRGGSLPNNLENKTAQLASQMTHEQLHACICL